MECLDVYSRLVDVHFQAQRDCDADSSKCALLKVCLGRGTSGPHEMIYTAHT